MTIAKQTFITVDSSRSIDVRESRLLTHQPLFNAVATRHHPSTQHHTQLVCRTPPALATHAARCHVIRLCDVNAAGARVGHVGPATRTLRCCHTRAEVAAPLTRVRCVGGGGGGGRGCAWGRGERTAWLGDCVALDT